VMVINQETALISGQVTKDGHYALRIRAEAGDYLELWYEQGLYASSPRGFQAPLTDARPADGGSVDGGLAADSGLADGGLLATEGNLAPDAAASSDGATSAP